MRPTEPGAGLPEADQPEATAHASHTGRASFCTRLAALALAAALAAAPAPARQESAEGEAPDSTGAPAESTEKAGKAEPAEKEAHKNNIRWATATEVDNFGFDVFRGDSEDGPFERLNDETILGAGTTDEPSYYLWVDDTIDPYKAYYYYVESISMDNVRELFTPVIKAKPKLEKEEGEAEAEKAPAEGESQG